MNKMKQTNRREGTNEWNHTEPSEQLHIDCHASPLCFIFPFQLNLSWRLNIA